MLAAGAAAVRTFPADAAILQVYGTELYRSPSDFLQAYLTLIARHSLLGNDYDALIDDVVLEPGMLDLLVSAMESGEAKSKR